MKRPFASHGGEVPGQRRKRALSEDDRALWEMVAKQVKPLKKKPRVPKLHPPMSTAEPASAPPAAPSRPIVPVHVAKPIKPAMPPLVPLGRRERSRLSRGRSEIDARLD